MHKTSGFFFAIVFFVAWRIAGVQIQPEVTYLGWCMVLAGYLAGGAYYVDRKG